MAIATKTNLTGIWQGLYSYPHARSPVSFTATLLESGAWLSGAVHETTQDEWGDWFEACSTLLGKRSHSAVAFTKTYDGLCGWSHSVSYEGVVSCDATEIEGRWSILDGLSGRFLMMRPEGRRARRLFEAFEQA